MDLQEHALVVEREREVDRHRVHRRRGALGAKPDEVGLVVAGAVDVVGRPAHALRLALAPLKHLGGCRTRVPAIEPPTVRCRRGSAPLLGLLLAEGIAARAHHHPGTKSANAR